MAKTKLNHQQKHAFTSITSGFAAALLIIILLSLVLFIFARGSAYFWPMTIYQVDYQSTNKQVTKSFQISSLNIDELKLNLQGRLESQFVSGTPSPTIKINKASEVYQILLKSGKVELGSLQDLHTPAGSAQALNDFVSVKGEVDDLLANLQVIQFEHLEPIHIELSQFDKSGVDRDAPARLKSLERFKKWQIQLETLEQKLAQFFILFETAEGDIFKIDVRNIDAVYQPNEMSYIMKLSYMFEKFGQFVSDTPKQASTSGGVFPALFGTVLMVLLMAVFVAPLGIMAAVYLHEYAPDGAITSFIRISISNMAGVPSVVYGVFGLGFFVYVVGGSIDSLFYADNLPSPTFGAPGLFWAALTMALLTLPVVIVSTEEGLRRVPEGLKAGAYALGATKLETITKTIVPIASPGMITGLILAVARAAGEVAPLILVGAVKFAPSLPVDGDFPFLHLERQFMHLGVFIYDGAFHNQTNTQGSAMMFASCLLLLIIVFVLNLFAIVVRNKLRNRYVR